jgi:light-regulated signal transduction histidine kinase (bacteriophytochrome)
MVASDLQEPLRALVGQIERFQPRREAGGAADLAHAGVVYTLHAVRNMDLLIQCVLDYAQVGRQSGPFDRVDLQDAWREACSQVEDALTESGAEIHAEALPSVRGNRELLVGLFRNLLDNAIKYRGDRAPRIDVSSEQKGNMWVVAVRDNGIGVDPDEAGEIFLMFNRSSRQPGLPGLGMGLALCRKIVQYHGGRIWVDGEPGKGSTFQFNLPVE